MAVPLRFTIRHLLVAILLVALSLTVILQKIERQRDRQELRALQERLLLAQQALGELHVEVPTRAYVIATPSYAYARWTWRVHLPPGSRYALRIDVGPINGNGSLTAVSPAQSLSQQMGLAGHGETVIIAEQIYANGKPHLGVTVDKSHTLCRLTEPVAKCLGDRLPHTEEQLGAAGPVSFSTDETIRLLQRQYPHPPSDDTRPAAPVGLTVRLEPM